MQQQRVIVNLFYSQLYGWYSSRGDITSIERCHERKVDVLGRFMVTSHITVPRTVGVSIGIQYFAATSEKKQKKHIPAVHW